MRKTRSVVGGLITAANRIHVVASEANRVKVSAFNFSPGSAQITPLYYRNYGKSSAPFVGATVIFDAGLNFLYVGGSVNGRPSMTKIKMSDGLSTFSYMI